MFVQMSTFVDNVFLNQQRSFLKGYSTQHCLLVILERWKSYVDRKMEELCR